MKLLLVSMNFAPEPTGIGKYSGEMAHALAARGFDVRVVCAPPYYPQWQVQPGHRSGVYDVRDEAPGLRVIRCPLWVPASPSGIGRLLHMASFAASSLPVLLAQARWRPDVVLVVAPALFTAPGAWLAARLSGAVAWLHVQDLEVDAAYSVGLLSGTLLRRSALALERLLLRRFDRVSSIAGGMLRRLAAKGVPLQRLALLPNWVDVDGPPGADVDAEAAALRRALGIAPEAVVCLFSGTLNRKHGLHTLLQAARQLRRAPLIVFVVCGEGDQRAVLHQAAADLPALRWLPLQAPERLGVLLRMADIHLLPQLRSAADLVMPSKLGGMLASGRPVIAAAHPGTELARVVHGKGRAVEPESVDALVQAIEALAGDPGQRAALGAAGVAHARTALGAQALFDGLAGQLRAVVALQRRPCTAAEGGAADLPTRLAWYGPPQAVPRDGRFANANANAGANACVSVATLHDERSR